MQITMEKAINLYLVSDSSGETVLSVSGAVMAQFENVVANKYMWPMVRNSAQIDRLIEYMTDLPGIVLFTLVDKELTSYLQDQCNRLHIPCISAIAPVVWEIEKYLNLPAGRKIPGWQHATLDDYYFQKIAAIDFTMRHDDGQIPEGINDADILLVGVSRTSKTPTCLYLAQRGYKAANIPYVFGKQLGMEPESIKNPMVVALTVSPDRLRLIRHSRLLAIGDKGGSDDSSYSDDGAIKDELREALKFYDRYNWPVIDVSGRAVEETAAEIMSLYNEKRGFKPA